MAQGYDTNVAPPSQSASKLTQYQALPEYTSAANDPHFSIPGAALPGKSQNLQGSFDSQMAGAQDYAKNLQSNSDALYNVYASKARGQLPGLIQQDRNTANSRGLLNSGMEKGAEAGTVQNLNTGLAGERAQINQGLNQNLNQMEGGAFGTAGLMAQPGPQTAQTQLQGAGTLLTANAGLAAQNQQLFGSLMGGAGSIAGTGLANSMQANGNNPNYGYTPQQYSGYGSGSSPMNPYAPQQPYG